MNMTNSMMAHEYGKLEGPGLINSHQFVWTSAVCIPDVVGCWAH